LCTKTHRLNTVVAHNRQYLEYPEKYIDNEHHDDGANADKNLCKIEFAVL